MSRAIRNFLKKHLEMSRQLHYEAKKILKLGLILEDDVKEAIRDVTERKKLNKERFKNKVTILMEKQKYFALKNAINAHITDPDLRIEEIIAKYKVRYDSLNKEVIKRKEMGSSYRFDPLIKLSNVFTYSEEFAIIDDLCAWKRKAESNDKCICQLCALMHLRTLAYKIAKKKEKCPKNWAKAAKMKWLYYYEMRHTKAIRKHFVSPNECKYKLWSFLEEQISGSSASSASMEEDQSPSFDVSSMPNYEASTSRQQPPVSSQTSISHADMPGSSQQRIQEVSDVHIRKTIREHLNMYPQLHEAATAVLTNGEEIADRALKHNLDFWILERKVQILKRTNNYLKLQFPNAIQYYLQNANIHDIDVQELLFITAKKFDIGTEFKEHLKDEAQRFAYLNYIYKNITIPYEVFTSSQEEKILELLYQWKEANVHPCHCIICAMEHLLSMAYEFAKKENIQYPSIWNFNKADELWLLEFYMRNSEEMDLRFLPASKCTKEPMPPASTATCARESSSLLEISEQTTSFGHQSKRPKLSEDSNVPKSDEEKSEIIRERIKGHLEISNLLDKAAKQVLDEEYKDIVKVAREYQLNPWMLKQKVHIIELRRTQFLWKYKVEPAVHAVKFNILSICDAAKEYNVKESDIHERLEQLKNPKSCIYLHEIIQTDDEVLTCEDEFLLLKKLEAQVNGEWNPNCACRTCALKILFNLAYKYAIEDKKYPIAWKDKADEIWLYKFEMRHSIEISQYFGLECIADNRSSNSPWAKMDI